MEAKYVIGGIAVFLVAVVVVVLSVLLTPQTANFRSTFKERCKGHGESTDKCEILLDTFQEAYVGKSPCDFDETNYDQVFVSYRFSHQCGRTMLWSGTQDVVDRFAENRGGILLDKTLLGSVLNGLNWCGMKPNKETYYYFCDICKPNPKTAFWNAASAKFAEYACGTVTAILDGERDEPYHPKSTFASVEVPRLQPYRVKHLQVLLVKKEKEGTCTCESLGNLRQDLHSKIGCSCQVSTGTRVLPSIVKVLVSYSVCQIIVGWLNLSVAQHSST